MHIFLQMTDFVPFRKVLCTNYCQTVGIESDISVLLTNHLNTLSSSKHFIKSDAVLNISRFIGRNFGQMEHLIQMATLPLVAWPSHGPPLSCMVLSRLRFPN